MRSPLLRLLGLLVALATIGAGAAAGEDAEPPSLPRALWLEKTARDPAAALAVFRALAADPSADAALRAEAGLGEARCLVALRRDEEAVAVWRRLEADASAPPATREEARARREEAALKRTRAADEAAEAAAREALRRAEEARLDREGRLAAARRLVESAAAHVRAGRHEQAREDLLGALERDPGDERAIALLEEVGGATDRGELLRQAIRFASTNRLVDFRRLVAGVEALRKAGLRLVREDKPHLAVQPLRRAIERVDDSDFWPEMAETRRGLVVLLRKALDDARARGLAPEDARDVPDVTPALPPATPAWRTEFFALLARMFTSGEEGPTSVRFVDAAVPPNPTPEARGGGFAASGLPATPQPGSLRRAAWIEHHLRDEVAPGTWTGSDRLLERYDDLLVVQHAPGILREADAVVAAFGTTPPEPVRAEIRVYAAESGAAAEALRALGASVAAGEPEGGVVLRGRRIEEQTDLLRAAPRVRLLAQASLRLTGRHAALVRFRLPTAQAPGYAEGGDPPLRIADRDATYGLDLEVYAEDLPGRAGESAVSVRATARRPERPRAVLSPRGTLRVPVFSEQGVQADRRVPHAGALAAVPLLNPFVGIGADREGGPATHPDLLVLVAAVPAAAAARPDLPAPEAPPVAADGRETRQHDLGPVGGEIEDDPPPEDWPSAAVAEGSRAGAARRQRDAFLAGWLAERAGIPATAGGIVVAEGRATATLLPAAHDRLAREVAALRRAQGRVFTLDVRAAETTAERAAAWLAEAGERPAAPDQRVWRLAPGAAARVEEHLAGQADPASVHALDARLAARHTQLVTARAVRSRSLVTDFRVVRGEDGSERALPVNGTAEEGILVGVRPLESVGDLATLYVNAVLARIERVDRWTPPDLPGDAPSVALPRHRIERAGGAGAVGPRDVLLLVVPAPGSDGGRVVLVRVRHGGV